MADRGEDFFAVSILFCTFAAGFGSPARGPRGNQVRILNSPAAVCSIVTSDRKTTDWRQSGRCHCRSKSENLPVPSKCPICLGVRLTENTYGK